MLWLVHTKEVVKGIVLNLELEFKNTKCRNTITDDKKSCPGKTLHLRVKNPAPKKLILYCVLKAKTKFSHL